MSSSLGHFCEIIWSLDKVPCPKGRRKAWGLPLDDKTLWLLPKGQQSCILASDKGEERTVHSPEPTMHTTTDHTPIKEPYQVFSFWIHCCNYSSGILCNIGCTSQKGTDLVLVAQNLVSETQNLVSETFYFWAQQGLPASPLPVIYQ